MRHREPGPSLPSLGLGKQTGQPNPNVETQTLGAHTPDSSAFGDLELPGPTPWLSDLFPSSTDGDGDGDGNALSLEWGSSPSKSDTFSFSALLTGDDETSTDPWLVPPDVSLSSLADGSVLPDCITNMLNETSSDDPGVVSSDVLAQRFDRITCGILSVKDGTYENPWRTLIWPLAKDTPALYHALVSLAAFHSCKTNPEYRVHGVDHMRKSIKHMVQDIQNMRTDAALATSLALAFADTWDQHTHSCIQHLRGAKALVSQLLDQTVQGNVCGVDLERVRFLYNTWLYMDVTARLTSRDGSESPEMDMSVFNLPGDAVHEVDPLMGCAATLFPLLNRVAGLVQRVRKSDSNSISLVSQAIELKRLVEQWEPPQWFEPPEDPSSEVQHSIQTAHACRWATLLYLHQAVPEMPSEPTSELAKRVLILLATVPPSSRTIVIQKLPLLAAGCEAEQDEDREWVLSRWMSIQSRLMLGSVDKCIEVIQEVWARRDAFQAAAAVQGQPHEHKRSLSGGAAARGRDIYSPPEPWKKDRVVSTATSRQSPRRGSAVTGLENIEYEKTVRGRLHWINVMEQWGWEGKLFPKSFLYFALCVKTERADLCIHSFSGIKRHEPPSLNSRPQRKRLGDSRTTPVAVNLF